MANLSTQLTREVDEFYASGGNSEKDPSKIDACTNNIATTLLAIKSNSCASEDIDAQSVRALERLRDTVAPTINKLKGDGPLDTDTNKLKERVKRVKNALIGMDRILAHVSDTVSALWSSKRDSLKRDAIGHFDDTLSELVGIAESLPDGSTINKVTEAITTISLCVKNARINLKQRENLAKDSASQQLHRDCEAMDAKIKRLKDRLQEAAHRR